MGLRSADLGVSDFTHWDILLANLEILMQIFLSTSVSGTSGYFILNFFILNLSNLLEYSRL